MMNSAVLCILSLFVCGCNSNGVRDLLNEQKILKDSAYNINEGIGGCTEKGLNGSAKAKQKQLAAVYTRLIQIQSSIDSLEKIK